MNTAATARTGNMVFTLSRGGRVVATLTGTVTTVAAGASAVFELMSSQRYSLGAFGYTFRSTFGF